MDTEASQILGEGALYEGVSFYFMQPDLATVKPRHRTPQSGDGKAVPQAMVPCHKTLFDHTVAFLNSMAEKHRSFKGTPAKWEKLWEKSLKKSKKFAI
jgi:hypothetical protein